MHHKAKQKIMSKKSNLSEQDISTKYIVPSIQNSGWDIMTQVSEQKFITDGRIILSGKNTKRGERKKTPKIEDKK